MFFHYTSRDYAQRIMVDGSLRPGRSRKVYLTRDVYANGDDAANYLAILDKPVEVAFSIPEERVRNARPPAGRHVDRMVLGGEEIRPGCGMEWYTEDEVDVRGLECRDLD